jgi:heavy metal sensor kinase
VKAKSIRLRLTWWYFGILCLALAVFGGGVWLAMRQSLFAAVDASLRDRVEGVRRFIQQESPGLNLDDIQFEFREHSVLGPGGDLFQVADVEGRWIYRSDPLYDSNVPIYRSAQLGAGPRLETIEIRGTRLRFYSSNVIAHGRTYTVQVAAPVHEIEVALATFLWMLLGGVPALLLVASVGGYWISRRALSPVDHIITAARSITAQSLSKRLPVPETGDELQRLSETLNEMFGRLDAAFARITQFTADASHELRTPVALMRTTAELALRRNRDDREYREALSQILKELEQTSDLIEDLLLLARADSGAGFLKFQRTDLNESAAEASNQARVFAEAKGLHFEARLPEGATYVSGDPSSLRRLFLILIDNAVKYTPSGGRVEVSLKQRNGTAFAEVSDTGVGISAEDLPHVFDRFYRADKARARDVGGVGLGLSIAHWIVAAHGGRIDVESGRGQGTTFRIQLPAED